MAFAADQRVSVITVQRAYESLERGGLIHSRRGKGLFISELHDHEKKDIASVSLAHNISLHCSCDLRRPEAAGRESGGGAGFEAEHREARSHEMTTRTQS